MNLCIPWLIPLGAAIALLTLVLRRIDMPWWAGCKAEKLYQWSIGGKTHFLWKEPYPAYGHYSGCASEFFFLGTYVIDIAR
jgi:hypothetical protein